MTTTATGAPQGAPRRSGKKGTSSTNGKGSHITWHGLDLLLPPEAPGDLAFSIEEGEASAAVREIFGEAQYTQIRSTLKGEGLTMTQTFVALRELLEACFTEWNVEAGE